MSHIGPPLLFMRFGLTKGIPIQAFLLINMFTTMELQTLEVSIPEADKLPWRAIFAQPITYPPPADHLLFPNPQAPESHVQSFVVTD